VATLDSITQLDFSHNRCPHVLLDQGHNVSVSVCRWRLGMRSW